MYLRMPERMCKDIICGHSDDNVRVMYITDSAFEGLINAYS